MNVIETKLPGVLIIEPEIHQDPRGFFVETFHAERYRDEAGIDLPFVQDNHSRSRKGTLRGLHAQRRHPQGKLVRVACGEVFDVAGFFDPEDEIGVIWSDPEVRITWPTEQPIVSERDARLPRLAELRLRP